MNPFSETRELHLADTVFHHPRLNSNTVKPRYSVFPGTGQNHALYRGFLYCQHKSDYENTAKDQNLSALWAELC